MSERIINLTRDFFNFRNTHRILDSYNDYSKLIVKQFPIMKENSEFLSDKNARTLSIHTAITMNRRCELLFTENGNSSVVLDFGLPYLSLQIFRLARLKRGADAGETKISDQMISTLSWILGASLRMERLFELGRFKEAFGYHQTIKEFRKNELLSRFISIMFLDDLRDDGEREIFFHSLFHILDHEILHYSQLVEDIDRAKVDQFYSEIIGFLRDGVSQRDQYIDILQNEFSRTISLNEDGKAYELPKSIAHELWEKDSYILRNLERTAGPSSEIISDIITMADLYQNLKNRYSTEDHFTKELMEGCASRPITVQLALFYAVGLMSTVRLEAAELDDKEYIIQSCLSSTSTQSMRHQTILMVARPLVADLQREFGLREDLVSIVERNFDEYQFLFEYAIAGYRHLSRINRLKTEERIVQVGHHTMSREKISVESTETIVRYQMNPLCFPMVFLSKIIY